MYKISFIYEGNLVEFKKTNLKNLYTSSLDWLNKNGYTFKGEVHSTFNRRIHSIDEVRKMIGVYQMSHFYNIDNSGKYILYNDISINKILPNILYMLKNFGIGESTIKTEGFETYSRIKKFGEIENDLESKDFIETKSKKMTFLVACQFVLKQNDNRPMNAKEIWEEINKQNLTKTNGLTPWDTINAKMILSSINTTAKGKKKNSIFQIIEGTKPYKFILLNPDNIQNVPDEDLEEIIDGDYDVDDVENFSKRFGIPTDFKASQSQEEKESPKKYIENPFGGIEDSSAFCILGKSGSGKSTSTEIALEEMGHEYELMLAIDGEYTFSQYNGQNFEMSSFGEFLMRAQNDPKRCYTAIFDECHRPITINKINTDLLQALSRKRNRDGKRFITMDRSTKRMYTTPNEEFPIAMTEERGKILIPDNFGIICLSSNAAIICRNDDFLNRVDLIIFHQSDRDIKDLTQLKKLEPNEKNIETIRGLLLNDGKSEL